MQNRTSNERRRRRRRRTRNVAYQIDFAISSARRDTTGSEILMVSERTISNAMTPMAAKTTIHETILDILLSMTAPVIPIATVLKPGAEDS